MELPKPKNWDEFEEIALTCFQIKWSSPDLVRHGRTGQAQHGVDIYGPDSLEQLVGVQCKKTEELTMAAAKEEIDKAEKFEPAISAFYFATTVASDAKFQRDIRLLSHERVAAWDDLVRELVKNHAEFARHYPDLTLGEHYRRSENRRL